MAECKVKACQEPAIYNSEFCWDHLGDKKSYREKLVALDFELIQKMGIRHYGFNGTLHQAACADASFKRRLAGLTSMPRIVSVCLESRPEVAAVIGRRPLMVTSGTTPLEGIPGSTTCGDLD